jgi:hypothetical protein
LFCSFCSWVRVVAHSRGPLSRRACLRQNYLRRRALV